MNPSPTHADPRNRAQADVVIEAKPLREASAPLQAAVLHAPRVSVVIPCLNESRTIAGVVREALVWADGAGESIEVIVADNGSTDSSVALAEKAGARVVPIAERGYGSAIRGGLAGARHSIPWLNRTVGAPALSAIGRVLSGTDVRDFHCGYRAISRKALGRLTLACNGMEFATEMIVRAAQANLRIGQCPVTIRPAGRERPPHLRPFRDGLRHLAWMARNI